MFDPSIGRWFGEDPRGFGAGDPNLYRFVGNNPTNATDPSGLACWKRLAYGVYERGHYGLPADKNIRTAVITVTLEARIADDNRSVAARVLYKVVAAKNAGTTYLQGSKYKVSEIEGGFPGYGRTKNVEPVAERTDGRLSALVWTIELGVGCVDWFDTTYQGMLGVHGTDIPIGVNTGMVKSGPVQIAQTISWSITVNQNWIGGKVDLKETGAGRKEMEQLVPGLITPSEALHQVEGTGMERPGQFIFPERERKEK